LRPQKQLFDNIHFHLFSRVCGLKNGEHLTHLRQAVWQAATVAARYDPELKAYYQKKREEGKPYGVAIGAVCQKLLARIFIVLKEQRPYVIRDW
jgi:hypothetical protein